MKIVKWSNHPFSDLTLHEFVVLAAFDAISKNDVSNFYPHTFFQPRGSDLAGRKRATPLTSKSGLWPLSIASAFSAMARTFFIG
jgi:hypothetical protein